jgi:hypothetical protein
MKNFSVKSLGLLLLILVPIIAFAGNGKLAGTVKDDAGKPVPGANVMVEGTRLGNNADMNGVFFVLNIPPGTYNVTVSAVGFERRIYRGVVISSDRTTDMNFMLRESAVQVEAVIVEAERRLVEKTQTSTRTVVTADEIGALPVTNIYELSQNAASNYDGFVRGGQRYETKTIVDGVDLTDVYYAPAADNISPGQGYINSNRQNERENTVLDVSPRLVSELAVNTGGLGAEYKSATAGVINVNLKEARGPITVRFDGLMTAGKLTHFGPGVYDDANLYFAERDTLRAQGLRSTPIDSAKIRKANRYTWSPDKYNYGDKPEMNMELSAGGNLTKDLNFLLTGSYINEYGRFPNQFNRSVNIGLKSNYQLSDNSKITAFGLIQDRGKLFSWKNSRYSDVTRFFLEGTPVYDGLSWVGSLKWTNFLSPETFYEVQISHTDQENRQGYVDGNGDGVIQVGENGDFITFSDSSTIAKYVSDFSKDGYRGKFFSQGYTDDQAQVAFGSNAGGAAWKLARPVPFYEDIRSYDNTVKLDFTSQVTANHQLRAGAEFVARTMQLDRNSGNEQGYWLDVKEPIRRESYKYNPYDIGIYAQDRMEYAGLIVNLGLRLDGFNRDVAQFLNWFDAFHADSTINPGGVSYVQRKAATLQSDILPTAWYLSPRLGVSHPISDNAAMYFSFSRTTQLQPYSRLYANHEAINGITATYTSFPDVDMKPIRSTNYELGLQWSFAPTWGVDMNAYYRDMDDYSMIGGGITATSRVATTVSPGAPVTYYYYTSWGYADARGVEVTLKKLPSQLFNFMTLSGRLSYTFAFVKGAAYAGGNRLDYTSVRDSAAFAGDIPRNDIATVNTYEADLGGGNTTLSAGFDRTHRMNMSIVADFPYEIRLGLTGLAASGFFYRETLGDPRARSLASGPWRNVLNLHLEKGFTFMQRARVAVYVDVKNLLDAENILAYDNSISGQVVWEQTGDPTGLVKRVITPDGSYVYENPRTIYVGIQLQY